MKDFQLTTDSISRRVAEENKRQVAKWGVQDRHPFEWLTYLAEEVGELARAISEWNYRGGTKEDVIDEAIHAATLALKIAETFEQSEGQKNTITEWRVR